MTASGASGAGCGGPETPRSSAFARAGGVSPGAGSGTYSTVSFLMYLLGGGELELGAVISVCLRACFACEHARVRARMHCDQNAQPDAAASHMPSFWFQ